MLKDVSTNTKKAIAREFLLVLAVFAIGLVAYLAVYPYNYYKQHKANRLNSEILEKTKLRDSSRKENLEERPDYELWKRLKEKDYPSDFKRFRVVMSDKNKRDILYNLLKKEQLYSKSRNDFEYQFFAESYYSKKEVPADISTIVSQQPINDPIFLLHTGLIANGYKLPDINTFRTDMNDPEKRIRLHKALQNEGDYNKPLSDFESQYFASIIKTNESTSVFEQSINDPILDYAKKNGINVHDEVSYEKALRAAHIQNYSDMSFTEFKDKYIYKYGNPFIKNLDRIENKDALKNLQEVLQKQIDSISLLKERVLSEKLTTEIQYIEDHKKVNTIYSQQIQISFKLFIIALYLIFGVRYIFYGIKWSIITLRQ